LTTSDDREVLKVEDWAEIRRLRRAEGLAIQAIAASPPQEPNNRRSDLPLFV